MQLEISFEENQEKLWWLLPMHSKLLTKQRSGITKQIKKKKRTIVERKFVENTQNLEM
jgi:hypothetical protein